MNDITKRKEVNEMRMNKMIRPVMNWIGRLIDVRLHMNIVVGLRTR